MSYISRQRALFALALLASALVVACGGSKSTLDMPLGEARELNTEIRVIYTNLSGLMEATQGDVGRLRTLPEGISERNVDLGLVRQVTQDCFTTNIELTSAATDISIPGPASALAGDEPRILTDREDTGRAKSCQPRRMMVLESYIEALPPTQMEFVVERVLLADRVRVNLNDVLDAQIEHLGRINTDAERRLLALKQVAEHRLEEAQSPRVHADDRYRAEIDYETIQQEFSEIEVLIDEISTQIPRMRHLRRQLIDEAARNISQMGQS